MSKKLGYLPILRRIWEKIANFIHMRSDMSKKHKKLPQLTGNRWIDHIEETLEMVSSSRSFRG